MYKFCTENLCIEPVHEKWVQVLYKICCKEPANDPMCNFYANKSAKAEFIHIFFSVISRCRPRIPAEKKTRTWQVRSHHSPKTLLAWYPIGTEFNRTDQIGHDADNQPRTESRTHVTPKPHAALVYDVSENQSEAATAGG